MSGFGLDRISAPRGVAIVGGSRRRSSIGALILRNIQNGGFAGEIAVVNPIYAAIDHATTAPDLKSLPFVPDLIVITAPAPAIPQIIADAGKCGVAGAVIISSGLGHGPGSIVEAVPGCSAESTSAIDMAIPHCAAILFAGSRFASRADRSGRSASVVWPRRASSGSHSAAARIWSQAFGVTS